jgi:hypothetical protein
VASRVGRACATYYAGHKVGREIESVADGIGAMFLRPARHRFVRRPAGVACGLLPDHAGEKANLELTLPIELIHTQS